MYFGAPYSKGWPSEVWCERAPCPSWAGSKATHGGWCIWRCKGAKKKTCAETYTIWQKWKQKPHHIHVKPQWHWSKWKRKRNLCLFKVWRIENLELAEVDPSTYGQFYGGDCYLVLYTYQRSNRQQYILYMWQVSFLYFSLSSSGFGKHLLCIDDFTSAFHQGRHATKDEITACAYQAVNVDNKYNGAPVQIRVVMGKEPRHFLAIFKGKLIIFEVRFSQMFRGT